MAEGGITLLSMAASDAEDPQTLRMVAGAIANLCGNGTFTCFLVIHGVEMLYFLASLSFLLLKSKFSISFIYQIKIIGKLLKGIPAI